MAVTYHRVDAGGPTPERFVVNADGTFTPTRYIEGGLNVSITAPAVEYTHTRVAVTTVSSTALDRNSNRQCAMFINDSTQTVIYIAVGVAAQVNFGIRLNAAGGSFEMSDLDGNLDVDTVTCIHGGAGNQILLVTEGV